MLVILSQSSRGILYWIMSLAIVYSIYHLGQASTKRYCSMVTYMYSSRRSHSVSRKQRKQREPCGGSEQVPRYCRNSANPPQSDLPSTNDGIKGFLGNPQAMSNIHIIAAAQPALFLIVRFRGPSRLLLLSHIIPNKSR